MDDTHGLKPFGSLASLGLTQTTPPTGPPDTVSHILFSVGGTKVRVSVKGTPTVPGFIATWSVNADGSLSSSFTKSMPPSVSDGALPFGIENVIGAKDAVLASDVDLGVTVYDFSKTPTAYHPTAIQGQMATCWAQYSAKTASYWLSDFNANKIYNISVDLATLEASLKSSLALGTNGNPLEIRVVAIGSKEYVLIPPQGQLTCS